MVNTVDSKSTLLGGIGSSPIVSKGDSSNSCWPGIFLFYLLRLTHSRAALPQRKHRAGGDVFNPIRPKTSALTQWQPIRQPLFCPSHQLLAGLEGQL